MMKNWLIRRGAANLLVLFAAMLINFAIPRLMPGDPVDVFAGGVKLSAEARNALIKRFGLDASLPEQFLRYLQHAVQGDFGVSFYFFPRSVADVILQALPWTLLVIVSAILIQIVTGYLLGVISAWKAGTRTDAFLQTFSLAVFSAPMFWVAMVLLYLFGYRFGWLPLGGGFTPAAIYERPWDQAADIARHAILPILSLAISQYTAYQVILRNTMVAVLKEQYILNAEARGLSQRRIKHRHAARNALLPMLTFMGVSFSISIGGSVFIETVFSYPGIGKLIYDAVISRDYPLLQGCFLMLTIVVILVNFSVDILYKHLDPRIRY